jgi:hypothetical protein
MSFFASEVHFLQVISILPPSILEDSRGISTGYLILSFQIGPCRCQNQLILGRGSRTVRLRIEGNRRPRGHSVYPGSGPLDGGKTLLPA